MSRLLGHIVHHPKDQNVEICTQLIYIYIINPQTFVQYV